MVTFSSNSHAATKVQTQLGYPADLVLITSRLVLILQWSCAGWIEARAAATTCQRWCVGLGSASWISGIAQLLHLDGHAVKQQCPARRSKSSPYSMNANKAGVVLTPTKTLAGSS